MALDPTRSTLLSYNTVERLLRGDFFHTVQWESVSREIAQFPADWPVVGIGTTNWFKRNGEIIIQGTVAKPEVYWSDPEGLAPMHVIDLTTQRPTGPGPALLTPSLEDRIEIPAFPFLGVAVCDPSTARTWECPATENVHHWISAQMAEANLGLAAVRVSGDFSHVRYASAFYLPLEGLKLTEGYNAANNLKLAAHDGGHWSVGGIYAVNPTIQEITSIVGHPLHLHGYETRERLGGHIVNLQTPGVTVTVWPVRDLVMEVRNLDVAWQPIRNLSPG
ncbi:MAG: acetolactate decarboxylase [Verrucomicrobiae bacterium]|nr:acetolactate decarboxylase [Verrucomicrobiae bacterium]